MLKKTRPHVWKVKGEVPHQQYVAWHRARAQAHYRGELWMLTFAEFQQLWLGQWQFRGRGAEDLCMVRDDPDGAWVRGNVQVLPRIEYLVRQREYRSRNR